MKIARLAAPLLLLSAACAAPPPPISNVGLPETDGGIDTGASAPAPLPRNCYPVVPPELAPAPDQVAGLEPCG
jgi:hypothetical protein